MKVIICGAGQVGWQIARHLSGERNDVTVVDSNPDLVRRATDTLDVQGIAGFASYPDVLDRAGARDADMIIAATYSDEVNMVTCQVAHSVFGINRKIARIAQPVLSAVDLFRPLPPGPHAHRRGDQPRTGSGLRRPAAALGARRPSTPKCSWTARRSFSASRSRTNARW